MFRSICIFLFLSLSSFDRAVWAQDPGPATARKVPDGVYRVLRNGASEKDVAPLHEAEAIVIDRHRYAKADANEPSRYLVVHRAPEVALDLAREPVAERNGADVRVLLKLRPKAAESLERVTGEHPNGQLTIVLRGEVVTTHKIRSVIKDGDVQITSCAVGAADFLLEQLKTLRNAE